MDRLQDSRLFFGCFAFLGLTIGVTHWIIVPVPLQMLAYTFPILYIGSHLSLKMKEVDAATGELTIQSEVVSKKDALLFPFIGSFALFSLYLAYKFLSAYWVNLLITAYLALIGIAAVSECIGIVTDHFSVDFLDVSFVDVKFQLPGPLRKEEGPYVLKASRGQTVRHIVSMCIAILWMYTHHWAFHNIFAIAYCIQALRLISVGSVKIATILLVGLFFYDIFWVFGTDVMVTVALSLDAPVKIIFPISFSPWKQSILGLGDIVIPGIFIALILRFDEHLHAICKAPTKSDGATKTDRLKSNVDIHESFPKYYFWCNMIAYEAALMVTAIVMFVFKHAQPALLYLVPFSLVGLYLPAFLRGNLVDVLHYSEGEEEEKKDEKKSLDSSQTPSTAASPMEGDEVPSNAPADFKKRRPIVSAD